MPNTLSPDGIRSLFSQAMSDMYQTEVPLYSELLALVREVNQEVLASKPALQRQMQASGELKRLDVERHGAIRLGTAKELFTLRRMFAIMGMYPVGYYDLSVAGIPVHSTAFRPVHETALRNNPFRIFTSLLRLDLLADRELATIAEDILTKRQIFTPGALAFLERAEKQAGLSATEAQSFITEIIETFRWHADATVDSETYERLHQAHRLIADVVCFKGPHINHLTPRTLDIDAVQKRMPERGIHAKAVIEGPPRRRADILLRQTSFKALEEAVVFQGEQGAVSGTHSARFGEIEQRGIALTLKGRERYDNALAKVRQQASIDAQGQGVAAYQLALEKQFTVFADDYESLRKQQLAFFYYRANNDTPLEVTVESIEALIHQGFLSYEPITYEDFLPVSAAGIFQSNLGTDQQTNYSSAAKQKLFEEQLGTSVMSEFKLYQDLQDTSLKAALSTLNQLHLLSDD